MPIYEYTCDSCGQEFEELVYGEQKPPCPDCGSDKTTRLMSCANVKTSSASGGSHASSGGCGGCSGGSCSSCH